MENINGSRGLRKSEFDHSLTRMNIRAWANLGLIMGLSWLNPAQADDSPVGGQVEVPVKALRWGGVSGEACWALPLSKSQAIGPSHCAASSEGVLSMSRERDYTLFKNSSVVFLRESMRPIHNQPVGSFVVVDLGSRTPRVKITSSAGSSYELAGQFCPGDSGAPIWGVQDGRLRWLGMLVSGEGVGCSGRGIAIKSQAMHWAAFE